VISLTDLLLVHSDWADCKRVCCCWCCYCY